MGMRLEEGVREGHLSKEEVSTSKKYGSGFARKKEGEIHNCIGINIKFHQWFLYFPTIPIINLFQFNNNNVNNNNHNNEQTPTTKTIPTIIINKTSRGRRSLLTLFLCHTPNSTHLWFSRTYSNQEIRLKFQNHFHGGIRQSSVAPFIKELPPTILKTATISFTWRCFIFRQASLSDSFI